jgi:acyl-CoA synthetase (AMP-forming)/AMP-acid ligase II
VSGDHGSCSTLVELLRFWSLRNPDKYAYTFLADGESEELHLTYRELDRRARSLASKLQQLDARGARAVLLYPPGLEFIVALFGCLYAGVIAVPAYLPRLNRSLSRLQAIVEDAQASIALTTASLLPNIDLRFADAPELASLHWLATDTDAGSLGSEWLDPDAGADILAILQYTSGSTAAPKGVMVSHANILHNERMVQQASGHTESSVIVSWLPLFHDMGLIGKILQSLYIGGSCVFMSPVSFLHRPILWLRAITRYRATSSGGPNFGYDLCVRKTTPEERQGLDLTSWTVAYNAAEPVRHSTLEQFTATFKPWGFRSEVFYPCYGLAEATLFVTGGAREAAPKATAACDNIATRPAAQSPRRLLVGCGHGWMGQKIYIVDPISCLVQPGPEVGEIWVSGPSVARGYWNRPEQTECTFRAALAGSAEGPFLRTGDLGFFKDGELFITGRLKDLIIIRGRNIYPQDVEQSVQTCHPALRAGCGGAFSVDTADEERLVVVQELDARLCRDVDEVVGTIRQAVAEEHEVPVHEVVLIKPGAFPKTTSGKLQRQACKDKFLAGSLPGIVTYRGSSMPQGPDARLADARLLREVR